MEKNKFPIQQTEQRVIKRITVAKVFTDFLDAFNVERGLIYSLKLLFSRPGYLVSLYLHEGRFRIFNAFRLLVLTTAASLAIMYFSDFSEFFEGLEMGYTVEEEETNLESALVQKVFFDWYNLLLWLAIPIYGLFSFLFNRKKGFNYAEHMVMQSFYLSAINIVYIVALSVGFIFDGPHILLLALFLFAVYYFWMIAGWLKGKRFWFYLKNVVAFILANIIYSVLMFALLIAIAAYIQQKP